MTFDGTTVVTAVGIGVGWLAGVVLWLFGLHTRVNTHKADTDLALKDRDVAIAKANGRIDVVETRQNNVEADIREIKADVKEIVRIVRDK